MQKPLILTFDIGTQSARVMLVDKNGTIVSKVQKKYEVPYFSKKPNWAEQRCELYWETMCEICLQLKEGNEDNWDHIIAVTCATIRDSVVCVDRAGEPLRDMILWLDKRETMCSKKLPAFKNLIFNIVGMKEAAELQRKVSVCNWIKENEPEIWAKTDLYLMLSGYLTFKLCGKMIDSCANMIGHIPFDSKTRKWMTKNALTRCIFDVEQKKLCALVEPGEVLGQITQQAAESTGIPIGLPMIATGSDKGCETIGLSCTTPEKASVSFGTTATIQFTTNKYMEPLPFIPAFPAVMKGHYNPEVQIYRGYWLISWFKKEFAAKETEQAQALGVSAEQLLNERLSQIPPGCEGLMFQPYFTPGVVMPRARGAIIGFSDVHTRLHIYRAIIEGINFALIDGMKTMEKRGRIKIETVFVSGGGSQSDEICQITANMFGLPVCRIQTFEAAGLGSSLVGFVSMGIYKNYEEAIAAMVHIKDTFVPDENEHILYARLFSEVFLKIFPALLPLYKKSLEV